MSQRNDQDPQDPEGEEFNVKGQGPRGGKERRMRRKQEEGDTRGKGGRRNDQRGHGESYGTGPSGPGMTAVEKAMREAGVHIPTREELDHPAVDPVTEHVAPAVAPAAEITSLPVRQASPPAPAPVTAKPTAKTVLAGPTPEPTSTDATHKEETTMIAGLLGLPDLDVKPLTDEELKKAEQEAAQRRAWAEGAGKALTQLKADRAAIERSPDFAMSPTLKARHAQIVAQIAQIEGVTDQGVKSHAEFSELLNAIKAATTEQAQGMIDRTLKAGRIKEVPGAKGPKVLYWHGKSYTATTGTGGTDAMIVELIKLANRAKDENRDRWNSAIAAMKEKGRGLTLLAVGEGEPNDPSPLGMVYVHLPRTDGENKETHEKFVVPESHILVEVAKIEGKGRDDKPFTQYVIRPVQVMGGGRKREELFENLARAKAFISVRDFRYGNLPRFLQEKIPADAYDNIRRFMGLIRAALELERAAAKKAEEAKAKTAAPAVVATETPAAVETVAEPAAVVTDPPAAIEATGETGEAISPAAS